LEDNGVIIVQDGIIMIDFKPKPSYLKFQEIKTKKPRKSIYFLAVLGVFLVLDQIIRIINNL